MTPEKEAEIRRQFLERPGSRLVALSPDEDAALARAIDEEEAGKAENVARCKRLEQLLKEDSLAGDLRRRIEEDDRDYPALSAASGLEIDRLRSFFWGDGDLTIEEIDRLAKALHLRLAPATLS